LKIRFFDHPFRTRDQSPLMIYSLWHSMFSSEKLYRRLSNLRKLGLLKRSVVIKRLGYEVLRRLGQPDGA
jgi:hypothetical protein